MQTINMKVFIQIPKKVPMIWWEFGIKKYANHIAGQEKFHIQISIFVIK